MQSYNRQQGVVLLFTLMFLIILTLITFSSSRNVMLQQKMTSVAKQNIEVFEAAQKALRIGEKDVSDGGNIYTAIGSGGYFDGDCTVEDAVCFVKTITQFKDGLYDDAFWAGAPEVDTGVSCGDYCTITAQYIIVKMEELVLDLSPPNEILVITNHYQDQNENTSKNPFHYKIIVRAKAPNRALDKVLVSHYASTVL